MPNAHRHLLRGLLALVVCGVAAYSAKAAPLRSPWSDAGSPLSSAPSACPAIPLPAADLITDGFYRKDDPTHSIVDPERMKAYEQSAEPVKGAGRAIVASADDFRLTGSRAAARCVIARLAAMAGKGSLTGKMSSSQAYYVQGWVAGAMAVAFLKVRGSGLATPAENTAIAAWLLQIGKQTRDWYDEQEAKSQGSASNNHLYWAGVELAAIAAVADNQDDFSWAMQAYQVGVAQIQPNGTLPREMERGERALHYHLYALAPLVMLAEFGEANGRDLYSADAGALHRLVKLCVAGVDNTAPFVTATGKQQELSRPVSGDEIGWAPEYLERFPNARLQSFVGHAASLSVYYLGGLPPPSSRAQAPASRHAKRKPETGAGLIEVNAPRNVRLATP